MAIVAINRDPFARETIIRETVSPPRECAWCGSERGRFRYGSEPDGTLQRRYLSEEVFCSVGCWRSWIQ